jgi:SPP1 gp7 family putative phage head morphogenesis protein
MNYWQVRSLSRLNKAERLGLDAMQDIIPLYTKALKNVKADINKVYLEFSTEMGLDVGELRDVLTGAERTNYIKSMRKIMKDLGFEIPETNNYDYLKQLTRLEAIKQQIYWQIQAIAKEEEKISDKTYKRVIEESYKAANTDIREQMGRLKSFASLDETSVEEILNSRWEGSNYSKRIWKNTTELARKSRDVVGAGLLMGRSQQMMAAELTNEFNKGTYNSMRVIRTETNYFLNQSELQSYKDEGVKYYEYTAILDNRTSDICEELDGRVWKVEEAEVGYNYPPMHPNCRSRPEIVFEEEVEEKGGIETREHWEDHLDVLADESKQIKRFVQTYEPLPQEELYQGYEPTLQEWMARHQIAPREHGAIIDKKTGLILEEQLGTAGDINFTLRQWNEVEGNVLVHNHPPTPGGTTNLSAPDIEIAIRKGAYETVVVGEQGSYHMRLGELAEQSMKDRDKIAQEIKEQWLEATQKETEISNEFWNQIAKKYGFEYEFRPADFEQIQKKLRELENKALIVEGTVKQGPLKVREANPQNPEGKDMIKELRKKEVRDEYFDRTGFYDKQGNTKIELLTGDEINELNEAIRNNTLDKHIKDHDTLIEMFRNYETKKDLKFVRGIQYKENYPREIFKEGNIFTDDSYTYVAWNEEDALRYATREEGIPGAIVEIRTKKGSKIINGYEFNGQTYENLIDRNSSFLVKSIEETPGEPDRIVLELLSAKEQEAYMSKKDGSQIKNALNGVNEDEMIRFASDKSRTTDNLRGGTWYTNKEGAKVVLDAMNKKNVAEVAIGGENIYKVESMPMKNPLVIKDAMLEDGSFAVINSGYENFIPKKYAQAAEEMWQELEEISTKGKSTQDIQADVAEVLRDGLFNAGYSWNSPEVKAVFEELEKNKADAAMDLIISKGLKESGYDGLILRDGETEHIFKLKGVKAEVTKLKLPEEGSKDTTLEGLEGTTPKKKPTKREQELGWNQKDLALLGEEERKLLEEGEIGEGVAIEEGTPAQLLKKMQKDAPALYKDSKEEDITFGGMFARYNRKIYLNQEAENRSDILLHEVGHMIDTLKPIDDYGVPQRESQEWKKLMSNQDRKTNATAAFLMKGDRALEDFTMEEKRKLMGGQEVKGYKFDKELIEYYEEPQELFANAYYLYRRGRADKETKEYFDNLLNRKQ